MDERMSRRVLAELEQRGYFDQVPDVDAPPDARRAIAERSFVGASIALRLTVDDFAVAVRPAVAAAGQQLDRVLSTAFRRPGCADGDERNEEARG